MRGKDALEGKQAEMSSQSRRQASWLGSPATATPRSE